MIIRDGTNNHEKYPPSALFLMTTLDPLLLHLALFVRVGAGRAERLLRSIAEAPLFIYVLPFCALRIVELGAAV